MDSIDPNTLARTVRLRYEWSRAWRAALGFAPTLLLVGVAAAVSPRSASVVLLGALLFGTGVALLWYGHGLQRAVLPGVFAGVVPLLSALCANHWGHVCTGEGCVSLCLPACIAGGLAAGLLLGYWALDSGAQRRQRGFGFVLAASCLALLTGAMGCACIGYSGIFGLIAGYSVGLLPTAARALRARIGK